MGYSKEQLDQVKEFMKVGSQEVNEEFTYQSLKVGNFRLKLIDEELNGPKELIDSMMNDNPVGMLDGICDVLYVVYGAYATYGLQVANWFVQHEGFAVSPILPMHESIKHIQHLRAGYDRLKRGMEIGDQRTIQAGLDDVLHSTLDLGTTCGFDLTGAFDEVHRSNMSKFCASSDEAAESILLRLDEGNEQYKDATIQEVVVDDKVFYIIKRAGDGKILKGSKFFEPDLAQYISTGDK